MRNGDYTLVIAPPQYPGKKYRERYCYEHHLVWWQHTGEVVSKDEVVHHINGKHRDNNFSNLLKLSTTEHNKLHSAVRKRKVGLRCAYCGRTFARSLSQVKMALSLGQKDFYCNHGCTAGAYGRGRSKRAPL